jgi:retron-type reverse transcriptase
MTRSSAGMSCGAWVMVRSNKGAPGIDKITLAAVEEYEVTRLLDELAAELKEGRYCPVPARWVYIPKPGAREEKNGITAAPRAGKPWRERPNTCGERRR